MESMVKCKLCGKELENKHGLKSHMGLMHSDKRYRDKEWLRKKYVDEERFGTEIAEMCGVDPNTVYRWLRKFGIKVYHKGTRSNFLKLSDELLEFLDGLLLGDGCVYPHRKSAVYVHTDKHKEYLEWLSGKLESLGIKEVCLHPDAEGREIFKYRSRAYVDLMEVRERWYPNDTKYIPSDVEITPTVLMNWYVGDGSFDKGERRVRISAFNQMQDGLPVIKAQLEEKDIYPTLNSGGLEINKSESIDNFFQYLDNTEIPPCYDYKFL